MSKSQVYVATKNFDTEIDGQRVRITAGTSRAREGHELLKRYPDYFEPITVQFEVEDARNTPPPAKKSAAKKSAAKKSAAKKADSDKGSDKD